MSEVGVNYYKKGALISYLTIAVNIVASLLYTPWMLSKIGDSDYGLYTLAVTFINMFLIDFGLSSAVSRFVAKYNAQGDQEKIDNFLGMLYKLYAIITGIVLIALIVLFFFVDKIYVALTPQEIEKFKVVYLIAGTYTVLSFPFASTFNGILNAYEKYYQMKLCELFHKIATVAVIVIALLCGLGLYALVTVNAVTGAVMLLVKWRLLKKTTKLKINLRYFDKGLLKEIFSFSLWVTVSSICSRLIFNITPSILAITVSSTAITLFNLASVIEGYTYTFASAVDGMFIPKIARLVEKDASGQSVQPLLTKVGRIQFFIITLIFVGFIAVGKEFVYLWLGQGYEIVYYCSILLIAPAPFYLSQQIAKNAMVVKGYVKEQAVVNICKALVSVVGVVVLSYYLGSIGAALSICISYLVRNIGLNVIYQKKLHLDMWKFHLDCYVKPLPAILIGVGVAIVLNVVLPTYSWLTFLIKVVGIVVGFFVGMWLIGFNEYEKSLFRSIVLNIKRR